MRRTISIHAQTLRGQNITSLALIVGGLLALSFISYHWIARGDLTRLVIICLGLVVLGIGLIVLSNWRFGLYLFLIWLVFEDLPRKYLGNNMIIYFGKDVLVGIAYVAFFITHKRNRVRTFSPPFLFPLLLFAGLSFIQVFNPNSPSILFGIVGLKLYLYYVPLLFLGYALIRSERDLQVFLVLNLIVAGVVALLGIIQAIVGLNFLNPQVVAPELAMLSQLVKQAPSGVLVPRPCSVFVSDARFSYYMLFMLLLGLGTAGYMLLRGYSGKKIGIIFLGIGLFISAIVMSGGRAPFMFMLGNILVFAAASLWGAFHHRYQRVQLVRAIEWVFIISGIGLLILILIFPDEIGARWSYYYETIAPWSPTTELGYRLKEYPVGNFLEAFSHPEWPVGYGIGTASLGIQYVAAFLGISPPELWVENGFGVLVVELGILGLLLWVAWTVALIYSGWRITKRLRGTAVFPVGFVILWFAFLLLIVFTWGAISSYQNFIFNAYLWLLVGILFRLPGLVAEGQIRARTPAHGR